MMSRGGRKAYLSVEKARERQVGISWDVHKLPWKLNANFHLFPSESEIKKEVEIGQRWSGNMSVKNEPYHWNEALWDTHLLSAKIPLPCAGIQTRQCGKVLAFSPLPPQKSLLKSSCGYIPWTKEPWWWLDCCYNPCQHLSVQPRLGSAVRSTT